MAKKSRDYDNPVIVSLSFGDGRELTIAVSEYRVTDEHVILTRTGDSRVKKYISIHELKSFQFDEPLSYRQPSQSSPWVSSGTVAIPLNTTYTNTLASSAPQEAAPEAPIMQYRGHQVDLATKKVIKKATKLPTEAEVIDAASHGGAAAFG